MNKNKKMKTKKERLPVYQNIKNEMREWIQPGIWKQDGLIPVEAALAKEFGCARTTVNRALRELTQEGIIERRRKAGTRVVMPVRRPANFEIPRIRLEIEETGATYRYALLLREVTVPTANVRSSLKRLRESVLFTCIVCTTLTKPRSNSRIAG